MRKLVKQKRKITDNSPAGHDDIDNTYEYDPSIKPCAFQTDGYDSDIINQTPDNESVNFTEIVCPSVDDSFSKPVNKKCAEII